MKALVLTAKRHLEIQEVDQPEIGPDEVLIRVRACGICGSDVHGYTGAYSRRIPPIIMGHEAAGEIVRLGENVHDWEIGARVTFNSTISCGDCDYCQRGLSNLCDHRRIFGVSCEEYRRTGAFAEFVAVPKRILYRIPETLGYEEAAMSEPLAVAVHGVGISEISLDDSVMVIGAGVIGLLVIQTLRLATSGQIIAVDISDQRLALAKSLGADVTLNNQDSSRFEQALGKALTNGEADAVFDAVGLPQTVLLGFQHLRKGGTLTQLGNFADRVEVPLQAIVGRQLRWQGSCAAAGEYRTALQLMADKKVNVSRILSGVAPLEDGPAWFERLAGGEASEVYKVLLVP